MSKTKTIPQLKEEAWNLFSRLMKLKRADEDGNIPCFTCDATTKIGTSNCQGGHFWPRGGYAGLTFHPDNSKIQCFRCNHHLKGNFGEFRIRLINEIGQDRVDWLEEHRHDQLKISRGEYLEMISNLKEEIKNFEDNS